MSEILAPSDSENEGIAQIVDEVEEVVVADGGRMVVDPGPRGPHAGALRTAAGALQHAVRPIRMFLEAEEVAGAMVEAGP